jgi:adenylosuccinate lyase
MLNTMLHSSRVIVTRPAVASFEEHERDAFGWALRYVTLGATITAAVGWLAHLALFWVLCSLVLIIIGFAG